jgi:hypothetical protein
MRQDVGLTFRGSRAVAAHGGKEERLRALRFPKVHYGPNNGRDIRDAAAAHSKRHARSGLDTRAESGLLQLTPHCVAHVRNSVIRKMLPDGNQPGK